MSRRYIQPFRDLLGHLIAEGFGKQRKSARGLSGVKCLCRVLCRSLPVLMFRVFGRARNGLDQILDLRRLQPGAGQEASNRQCCVMARSTAGPVAG